MLGCSVFIQIKIQLITHGSNCIDSCKTLLSEAASKVHSSEKLFIESNCKFLGEGGGALIYSALPSNHVEVKLLIGHSVGDHTMKNLTSIWLLSKFDWSNDPCWELLQ